MAFKSITKLINRMATKAVAERGYRDGHGHGMYRNALDFRNSAFYKNTHTDLPLVEAYDTAFQQGIVVGKRAAQIKAANAAHIAQKS